MTSDLCLSLRIPALLVRAHRKGDSMATKEDILEQLIEEYLTHKGYFVRQDRKSVV